MDWERPSERFMAYLERLSTACIGRDRETLEKLLRMRLASHLPRTILDEMEFFRRAKPTNMRAPLKLMRYVHQMKQLATAPQDTTQLPLELREREHAAPSTISETRRRPASRHSDATGGKGDRKQ